MNWWHALYDFLGGYCDGKRRVRHIWVSYLPIQWEHELALPAAMVPKMKEAFNLDESDGVHTNTWCELVRVVDSRGFAGLSFEGMNEPAIPCQNVYVPQSLLNDLYNTRGPIGIRSAEGAKEPSVVWFHLDT